MRKFYLIVFLLISALSFVRPIKAQNVPSVIDDAYALIEGGKYKESLVLLQNIDESQTYEHGDSCIMMYNYEMGSCFYFLDRYEEAIPYLSKALLKMEKLPHEDCIYLELIYGIGSCYNKLGQYHSAEKYLRRVMIRGNVLGFKCGITTQALSELTEVYDKLGYTKLAKECAIKINSKVEGFPSDRWSNRVKGLFDLAESYDAQKRYDEEIETYHKILELIESNIGKTNDEYLLYADLLRLKLRFQNRQEEIIVLLEDMINVGRSYQVHSEYVCHAYEDYLEIMAKQNKAELVEVLLPEAVKYIQHTKEYDWHNHNLYEWIGNAFAEAGNYSYGTMYLEMCWDGKQPNHLRSLGNLGRCYFKTNPTKSLEYYKRAEFMIDNNTTSLTLKSLYYDMYSLCSKMQKYDEAIKYAELTAPYLKEIDGNDAYVKHLTMWAIDCSNAQQFNKAQMLFEETKGLFSVVSDSTKVAYYSQYGFYLLKTNDSSKAIDVLEDGIKLCLKNIGNEFALLTTMYHNLGRAYMLEQDYARALLYLNKSKDLQIKLNGYAMQRTLDNIKECESK